MIASISRHFQGWHLLGFSFKLLAASEAHTREVASSQSKYVIEESEVGRNDLVIYTPSLNLPENSTDRLSCQCSSCNPEFEDKIMAKAMATAMPTAEAKVKNEWSKGYWADYLKANQSAWEAEVEEKFKEMEEKRLAEIALQTETGPTLDQAQMDQKIEEAKEEMKAALATDYNRNHNNSQFTRD